MRPITSFRPLVAVVAAFAAVVAPVIQLPAADAVGVDAVRRQPGGSTYRITLITGDKVVLKQDAGGKQAAWVDEPAGRGRPAHVYRQDGDVHVVPSEATALVESGVLDPDLFDVSLLARQGYDDAARDDLPLLLQKPSGASWGRGAPGVRRLRDVPAIDAVSVVADKDAMTGVWASLRGPQPARLAGATKVWLNKLVHTTLDRSVPQVGAPAAWAAGYDGKGIPVAVLDTGRDPAHPDLAGRVIAAKNFTESPDPAGQVAVDRNGHGTHVAATIAGSGAASGGKRKGVAPGARLMIGKVLDDNGSGTFDQIIEGMAWAVASGAKVVNMSVGSDGSSDGTDPLSEAVNKLTADSGALFVVAAGNNGPGEQTVGAPGAADAALTVGAVDKSDRPASFSSRGPRYGDLAVKPKIVAPGVDIVAARAAGTTLGNVLDRYYTSLSGTSMATPHVAGAAAILAQEHPGWKAADLKARLVTTSRHLRDQAVSFQGAGRLDVAAAIGGSVIADTAALSLGRLGIETAPIERTLTYSNPSGVPALVRLRADVTSTGATPRRPALALSRDRLLIPARGTASTTVRLTPGRTVSGQYAGRIVAESRGRTLDTPVGFAVDGPLRTVTITGVGRDGAPAGGPVDLWNADTGDWTRRFLRDGTATFEVPDGQYTLMATLETSLAGEWPPLSETIAGDPNLRISKDTTIGYDARTGRQVSVRTPRDSQQQVYDVMWHRSVGDHEFTTLAGQGIAGEVFLIESPRARQGVFEVTTEWQLAQPLLTATVSGPGGFRLRDPRPIGEPNLFTGTGRLAVVDAGYGRPEDYAGLDVHGKIALVTRHGEWGELTDQAAAAHTAGAAMMIAANDRPGEWREDVFRGQLPAYALSQVEGGKLKQAVAANPGLTLDLSGVADSTYTYELAYTTRGRIPAGQTYDAARTPMATMTSDYRQNSDRLVNREMWIPYVGSGAFGNALGLGRHGPVVRTEYVSTTDVEWTRFGQPSIYLGLYWVTTQPERLRPGGRYHQVWWGPLVHPGVPDLEGFEEIGSPVARFRDAIRIAMSHYLFGGKLRGAIAQQLGDTSPMVLRRNGTVIGTADWPEAQFTVPAGDAAYELSLDVANGKDHWSDTSVRTQSVWKFHSARSSRDRVVLPLVQVDYGVAAGPRNEVRADRPYPLRLTPGYQPQATGPGRFRLTAEVSYDDGATWSVAPVRGTVATLPPAPGDGFASVRITATDAAGNQLTQRIDRAYRVVTR